MATVVTSAPPAAVWGRWSELEAWPQWNPFCRSARMEGPLRPGTRLELQLVHPRGRDFWTRPILTAVRPEEELSWAARGLGLVAATVTTLEPEGDGTRVTMVSQARGPLAFMFRMALTDKTQVALSTGMLRALAESLAP